MPKTVHEQLIEEFLERQKSVGKEAEFNSGILTADRYLSTLQKCVGTDLCYRYAATKSSSFNDLMTKAASTLTYNNPDMVVEDNYSDWKKDFNLSDMYGSDIELPKDTLMVFKHTLTTPRKDRDNDVLRTQGAVPDPRMLMLWQHTHTLPIGKTLGVAEHTKDKLSLVSALVDINELAHDSAVMIDNKMGRFSHGFRALDFAKNKDANGKETAGFEIKRFEVMEASLVSVPSNVDAEVEDILFSLNGRGKFTSALMKGYVKSFKEQKSSTTVSVPGSFNLNLHVHTNSDGSVKTVVEKDEDESNVESPTGSKCKGSDKPGTRCGCGGGKPAPEEGHADDGKSKDTDVKEMKCPECGGKMKDGACTKCNYVIKKSVKVGRSISAQTRQVLGTIQSHVHAIHDGELLISPKARKLCMEASGLVDHLIKTEIIEEDGSDKAIEFTAKEAMAVFITKSTSDQRKYLLKSLQALEKNENAAD